MIYKLTKTRNNLPACVYSIYFFDIKFSNQDIISVKNTLRRYRKKYPHIGYLLTISNTDSNHCLKREIRIKGQRGRPPTVVLGNKIQTHLHLSIIGDNNRSAYLPTTKIVKALNKRFEGKVAMRCLGKGTHAKNFIEYSLKQSNETWRTGLFKTITKKYKGIESLEF